jgi:hypothetical protein
MKKALLSLILIFLLNESVFTWGFFAHYKINKMAVFTLPESMNTFFLNHIQLLEDKAVNADKRKFTVKAEAPRHYIDIDAYSVDSPFAVVPRKWNDAVEKFSEDTLIKYGILPWHIQSQYFKLVNSLKEHNIERSINLLSDLGHYIADAHVPLHTTLNYDGQLSNQKGIHAFWESRLPELFAHNYDFFLPKVTYQEDMLSYVWAIIENSHSAKDSVLYFEEQLNAKFSSDTKYSIEEKGRKDKKVYSEDYSKAYHDMLDNMVERQMRSSILAIGTVWYSAWVDAGQPDMDEWSYKED